MQGLMVWQNMTADTKNFRAENVKETTGGRVAGFAV